jgi:hypothetical protein
MVTRFLDYLDEAAGGAMLNANKQSTGTIARHQDERPRHRPSQNGV